MPTNLWPPKELDAELAQIGRIVISFNALEKHTSGVLRQFIIDDFSDRVILGLCESLTGVELEKNLRRFAHVLEDQTEGSGCEDAIQHLIRVYQSGKSLRNRVVHELSNSLTYGEMHLHKHVFSPGHESKGLVLDTETLSTVVGWMSTAKQVGFGWPTLGSYDSVVPSDLEDVVWRANHHCGLRVRQGRHLRHWQAAAVAPKRIGPGPFC
jgi:hypothetical protein